MGILLVEEVIWIKALEGLEPFQVSGAKFCWLTQRVDKVLQREKTEEEVEGKGEWDPKALIQFDSSKAIYSLLGDAMEESLKSRSFVWQRAPATTTPTRIPSQAATLQNSEHLNCWSRDDVNGK
uniref:Reverse transcriptase domain-containing protein n=1 Tax=Steinernema glaseri TaxID=37863 RepID=A0A1I7Z2G6_9BILA